MGKRGARMSDRVGQFDERGVWRVCKDGYPQCMGRAATGSCTCRKQKRWCPKGCAVVPRDGMLCIECANKECERLAAELEAESIRLRACAGQRREARDAAEQLRDVLLAVGERDGFSKAELAKAPRLPWEPAPKQEEE